MAKRGGMKRYLLISRVALSNFGRKFEYILPLVECRVHRDRVKHVQPFQQFVDFIKNKR